MGSTQSLDPIAQAASACIHCGLCLEACPTYRESGLETQSPRGRIHLVEAVAEGRLDPWAGLNEALDSCVGCRACETACPAGVPYGAMLEAARARYVEPARPAGWRRAIARPLVRKLLPSAPLLAFISHPAQALKRLGLRRLPWPAPRMLQRAWAMLPSATGPGAPLMLAAQGPRQGRVALLAGCASEALFPKANAAAAKLLARAGYEVVAPPSAGCCGAVAAHDGDHEGALRAAKRNILAWEGLGLSAVISTAGGCGASLASYGELLAGEPEWAERAARISALSQDLASFLVGVGWAPPEGAASPVASLTWHDPCHLAHGMGVREAPRKLLKALKGANFQELPSADACCGGAGTYALFQPELSDALLGRKMASVAQSGASLVVTANPPCLMQLGRLLGSPNQVGLMHLAELLEGACTAADKASRPN